MSRTFDIERKPYGDALIYKKANITLEPGVTVLAGCNGSGKTTILQAIKTILGKEDIPVLSYDNLTEGGGSAKSKAGYYGDMELMATLMCSSEGEQIYINIAQLAREIGRFAKANQGAPELWFLFDAVDSGLSIDNVEELKTVLFSLIINDSPKSDVYIVISANEYEMCRGESCFDVFNGKYVRFNDYEEYRKFILDSRKQKDKRYQK